MKPSLLLLMSLITIIVTSVFWLSVFHSLPLSNKTDDWSNFGSYIGGVAGPALSFISILLVIETIKQTQNNHKQQVSLIIQEQTYSKFQDLCNFLESNLKESWLNYEKKEFPSIIQRIKKNILFHHRFKVESSVADKHAIALEEASAFFDGYPAGVDEITIIIRSVIQFIFSHNNNDKDLMINMIELKITKEQRFIIYILMRRDHPEDARLINQHWHSFCTYPWSN